MTDGPDGDVLRILSLDDDTANQSLIRAVLGRADDRQIRSAIVLEATTVGAARAVLETAAVDVVLLDVHLPDGLGLDLATELHTGGVRRPAVVALTASVLPIDEQSALDAGCDAFLAKPFSARGLVEAVRLQIDERAARIAGADALSSEG